MCNNPTIDVQDTRRWLQGLAFELVELSKSYEPASAGGWTFEDPIISKAKYLIAQIQTPDEYALSLLASTVEAASLRTLLHLDILQHIPSSPESINVADLAAMVDAEAPLLERLLRPFENSGFLIHHSDDGSYTHTPLSAAFVQNASSGSVFNFIYDEATLPVVRLPEYLEHQRQATGKVEEPGASRDHTKYNLGTWLAGREGEITTYQLMEENPARMKTFQKILGQFSSLQPYVGYYDFSKLAAVVDAEQPVLVDVGGGHGHAIVEILKAHPEIKPSQCVLQDTDNVITFARTNSDLPAGVRFQSHDYFSPQPIRRARAYYLRAVAHNISDAYLTRVLEQIVPAMAKDSKILIADNVIPEKGEQGLTALMDMLMMCMGGKERTEGNFREVIERVGLKVDGVYRAGGKTTYGIVEASLSES